MQEHFQLNIGFNFFFNTTLLKLLIVLRNYLKISLSTFDRILTNNR